jgi:hypothetical protein
VLEIIVKTNSRLLEIPIVLTDLTNGKSRIGFTTILLKEGMRRFTGYKIYEQIFFLPVQDEISILK